MAVAILPGSTCASPPTLPLHTLDELLPIGRLAVRADGHRAEGQMALESKRFGALH